MKLLLKFAILVSGFFIYSTQAEAACYPKYPFTSTTNISNYTIQRDLPVGSTIATIYSPTPSGQEIATCYNGGYIYDSFQYYTQTPTNISNVYATNISGVGISFSTVGGSYWGIPPKSIYYNGTIGVAENNSRVIKLIKTGPIASGSLQSGLVAKSYTDGGGDIAKYYISGGSVTSLACSLTTQSVSVPLDPVLANSFTAVNSTKGDKPFTIGLSCNAGARINASLSFAQNSETSNNSVIKLTGAGSSGVATGVGIQLLYGSTILKNNTNVVLKTASGGSQEFPAGAFTARYFQTKSTVTTGDANATATLNLTYQ